MISQSGALTSGSAMAAWLYPDCGTNILVSSGNEAITDLADYVDYLVDDPETTAIGLVIEKIRRPQAFFAAVARATAAASRWSRSSSPGTNARSDWQRRTPERSRVMPGSTTSHCARRAWRWPMTRTS